LRTAGRNWLKRGCTVKPTHPHFGSLFLHCKKIYDTLTGRACRLPRGIHPSLPVAGEAAPEAFRQSLNDAVTTFIVDKNIDNFANTLAQAAKQSAATK
jgi:hypothetical protein